jgi:DNA helicase-2/ATP-dependent DNA helicase PcrA
VAEPTGVVDVLHRAWSERRAVVVELTADPSSLREPERYDGPVYGLTPAFEFTRERLQFLVWANSYDARGGTPIWWHGRKAARKFAARGVTEEGPADVTLADGTHLYIDGGPPDPPTSAVGMGVVHRWSAEAGRFEPGGDLLRRVDLAPDQMSAVTHPSGPARVIAPAGSGKTRVLTERLAHLVGDRGVHPGSVSALAYNTRAADEMRRRCADLVTAEGPHLRTLNSTGLWICSEFGAGGRPRVVDEPEVRELLQGVFEIRRQANADTVAPYISALSSIRLGLTPPDVVEEEMADAEGIAEGFDRYRSTLADLGAVDFDEQIYRAIEILVTDSDARAAAQARCRRVLVDEFQDLTPAHLLMIRLLAAPGFDCFGVGDDDQVIYGYSGASPEFLIDFARYFPGASHHPLEVNYRCPPAVVAAARHLLSYNERRLEKSIRAPEGRADEVAPVAGPLAGSGPVAVRTAPGDALAGTAVEIVAAWLDAGVAPSEVAVLARVNSALLPVQVACLESGVPCTTPLTTSVLGRTGIRTAFAYLRIGADPGRIRREDVRDTIRRPSRGIAPMVVDMLTKGPTTSVRDIRRLADRLSGRDVPKLLAYADDLDLVVAAASGSTASALRCIRTGIGLNGTMDVLDSSRKEADRSTHADDLVALEAVAALHPDAATFEPWLRTVLSRPASDGPAVLLSTVHRIKGQEWDRVVVYGVSEGLLPHRLSDDDEGERRVFHVALTRARVQVAVVADADAPSIFVGELDGSRPRTAPGPAAHTRRPSGPVAAARRGVRTDRPDNGSSSGAELALRAWRSAVARRDGVPAYVVLNDKDLAGIVAQRPVTLSDLSRCRGIGPLKLERWGDEILAVLESAGGDVPAAVPPV